MKRRILIVGASGVFGERLARRLALMSDVVVVLAARRAEPLEALRRELISLEGPAEIAVAVLDRARPDGLHALRPWAVADCAGPFQSLDYSFAASVLDAGAHYLDIADGRGFVGGFAEALNARAQAAGLGAVSGVSTTPALTDAALSRLTQGWRALDRVEVALYPGAKAPRGLSVVEAVLSYAGQPVRVFNGGRWTVRPGWSGPRRLEAPGLGRRWAALCDTPDLDFIPQRHRPSSEAVFRAGAELTVMHLGLHALSWLVRLGLVRSLTPWAPPLRRVAEALGRFGSRRGGMLVDAFGRDAEGRSVQARWSLSAEVDGPYVPALPAAALLRAWLNDPPAPGARPCVGELTLEAIMTEASGLDVQTRTELAWPNDPSLHRRLLGGRFDGLPPAVRAVHEGRRTQTFAGRAVVGGGGALTAVLARRLGGFPAPGWRGPIFVEIAPSGRGERWTRRFGRTRFASRLHDVRDAPGRFSERFGPLIFVFDMQASERGVDWRFVRWALGPVSLPMKMAPRIRARIRGDDRCYRFSVQVAHPWSGLLAAYVGRLDSSGAEAPSPTETSLAPRRRERARVASGQR